MKLKSLQRFNLTDKEEPITLRAADIPPREGLIKKTLIIAFFLAILLAAIYYIFRPFLQPGIAGGNEIPTHFFKVTEIKNMLLRYGTYVDWSDKWYLGYHQFLFYPPLFYFFAAGIELFVNNIALTSKIVMIIGVIITTLTSYLLFYSIIPKNNRVWKRAAAAAFGSFAYTFNPILFSIFLVRGKPPDFFANSLAPLALYFLIRWLRTDRRRVPLAFAFMLTVILVTHMDTAAMLIVAGSVLTFVYLKSSLGHRGKLFNRAFHRPLYLLGISITAFVGLSAWFWLPYLAQIKEIGALGQIYSNRTPLPWTVFLRGPIVNGTTRYPGILLLTLALTAFAWRRTRKIARPWFSLTIVGAALSAFVYTPFAQELPAINTLFYYSGMASAVIAISALATITINEILTKDRRSFFKRYLPKTLARMTAQLIPLILVTVITVLLIFDASFIFSSHIVKTKPKILSANLQQASNFLRHAKSSKNSRILAVTPSFPVIAYLPRTTGKNFVNGYEVQSSRTSSVLEIFMHDKLPKKEERDDILSQLDRWNVEYVLVDTRAFKRDLNNLLATKRFKSVFANSDYTILHYKPAGYIQPITPVLAIGHSIDYPINVLDEVAGLGFIKGKSIFIDDYSLKELSEYSSIILYGFESNDPAKTESKLRAYMKQGGKLIIAMDSSLTNLLPGEKFLGVKMSSPEFNGLHQVSGVKPVKTTYSSNKKEWTGIYFDDSLKPWAKVDSKHTVIGSRRFGRGSALFIGYNLFYSAVSSGNIKEITMLRKVTKRFIHKAPASLAYENLPAIPGHKSFKISGAKPRWSLVSMAWSPYWRAYINGKEVTTKKYKSLLAIHLPAGKHRINLVYQRTPIHKVGIIISLITLAFMSLTPFIRRRRAQHVGPTFKPLPEKVGAEVKTPVKA